MKCYLHFGGVACGLPQGPFHTVQTEYKVTGGDLKSKTGYGSRMQTQYMVKHFGKWRRVYAINHGNWPTLYIGRDFGSESCIATVTFSN